MVALTKLFKRSRPEIAVQEPEPEREREELSPAGIRFMLLTPEGGFSYRLVAFAGEDEAMAYVEEHAAILRRETSLLLWTTHSESASEVPAVPDKAPEAVVIVRNPGREDMVQLYSFVEMDDARSFASESLEGGIEPDLVLIYWAVPVSLDECLEAAANQPPATRRPPEPVARQAAAASPPARRARARSQRRAKTAGAAEATPAAVPEAPSATPGESPLPRESSSAPGVGAKISGWGGWDGLAPLMVSASLLQADVYDKLRRDKNATGRAALIVGLMALAAAIAAAGSGPASILLHVATLALGWAIYIGAVYIIGTWVLVGRTEPFPRFFQAAGLASSPGLLIIFGSVPIYGPLIVLAASVWVAISVGVAASVVLELRREPALLASAVGWCLFFGISQAAPLALA